MTHAEVAKELIKCFKRGNKTLICGNGGSAAESQHFAAELVGKLNTRRRPLPAISLTTDTSILTAVANDFNFYYVFARQVEALGKKGDILITISTSGHSTNVNVAAMAALRQKMEVIELPRKGRNSQRIQEIQLRFIHDVCQIVEDEYLKDDWKSSFSEQSYNLSGNKDNVDWIKGGK